MDKDFINESKAGETTENLRNCLYREVSSISINGTL